jgi:hypothetical protein
LKRFVLPKTVNLINDATAISHPLFEEFPRIFAYELWTILCSKTLDGYGRNYLKKGKTRGWLTRVSRKVLPLNHFYPLNIDVYSNPTLRRSKSSSRG